MKKLITTVIALMLAINLFLPEQIFAQFNHVFSYQAVLRDNSNQLITNQTVGMRFTIIKGLLLYATTVYTETLTASTNANGLVTAIIGNNAGFSDIDWGNDIYRIKIETDPTGGTNYTIVSTNYLRSVPYAEYATNARNGFRDNNNSIFIGNGAGAVSTGSYNVFVGDSAGYNNTTAYENTAIGYSAFYSNTTGNYNIAIGDWALHSNTIGWYNIANGFKALYSNKTGDDNTAIGYRTLYYNKTGSGNTAIGNSCLYLNTGTDNTAIGSTALYSNTDGINNTATGQQALYNNTTGGNNTANGASALRYNEDGFRNTANGEYALSSNISGSYNTAIGYNADVTESNLVNATALGYLTHVNASNKVRIGDTYVTVIEGQVSWSVGSDIRLKNNVVYQKKLGLNFINDLKTVSFTYKNDSTHAHHDGLIAQDVQKTMEKLGVKFSGLIVNDNKEKILNLSYAEFTIPLINAVQEQQKQIEAQNMTIAAQQKQIDELMQIVEKLVKNQEVLNGNKLPK